MELFSYANIAHDSRFTIHESIWRHISRRRSPVDGTRESDLSGVLYCFSVLSLSFCISVFVGEWVTKELMSDRNMLSTLRKSWYCIFFCIFFLKEHSSTPEGYHNFHVFLAAISEYFLVLRVYYSCVVTYEWSPEKQKGMHVCDLNRSFRVFYCQRSLLKVFFLSSYVCLKA